MFLIGLRRCWYCILLIIQVDLNVSLNVNFFNIKNSHWEPIVEPWKFSFNVTRTVEGTMAISFSSKAKLEFNVSQACIQVLVKTMNRWKKKQQELLNEPNQRLASHRGVHSPYIIVNRTGYDLQIWGETSDGSGKGAELKQLHDGQEIPWRFGDWRVQRESTSASPNKISLQLAAAWESVKGISVDREGCTSYVLRPTMDDVSHQLVCQVKLRDNVKVVTLRSSLVLENMTEIDLEVVTINESGKITSKIFAVAPGEEFSFPIESSYSDRILVRPLGENLVF
jgi:vacuolar protein sorting-associated protein 13A/C